ncbi:hypothetical protein NPIL_594141, partial [Nephila pilipes]
MRFSWELFLMIYRTCQATCNPGYEFPDGSRQATSTCHDRDGRWSPKKDFDSCR